MVITFGATFVVETAVILLTLENIMNIRMIERCIMGALMSVIGKMQGAVKHGVFNSIFHSPFRGSTCNAIAAIRMP